MKSLIFTLIIGVQAFGAIPEKLIVEGINKKLDQIASAQAWRDFIAKNENLFPPTNKEKHQTSVVVTKEELVIDGVSHTLGVGYRQSFIRAPLEKVKKILNSPEIFRELYGLDAPADVEPIVEKSPREKLQSFKARIFKQVPLIPDQDYVLSYENVEEDGLWIQRAKLNKDHSRFALRDNLKILEPTKDGVIFREVSVIYALKWYVRFFGPSVRDVMNKELAKITDSVKCLAEQSGEVSADQASTCWKQASK